jgi:hypothetical protein
MARCSSHLCNLWLSHAAPHRGSSTGLEVLGAPAAERHTQDVTQPSESQSVFNKRTALKLFNWFRNADLHMAYHRALRLVFKAAWREKQSPCAFDANPLQWARECRDRTWWHLVQTECTRNEMHQQHLQHRRSGHQRTAWDDVFVMVFGPSWRAFRDLHASLTDWLKHAPAFMDNVFERWGLPKPWKQQHTDISPPLRCRILVSIDSHRPPEPHDIDWQWQSDQGRLRIQVDCRALPEVCAGGAFLATPYHRPIFARICRSIQFPYSLGLRPHPGHSGSRHLDAQRLQHCRRPCSQRHDGLRHIIDAFPHTLWPMHCYLERVFGSVWTAAVGPTLRRSLDLHCTQLSLLMVALQGAAGKIIDWQIVCISCGGGCFGVGLAVSRRMF